jgi:hypothetical protein
VPELTPESRTYCKRPDLWCVKGAVHDRFAPINAAAASRTRAGERFIQPGEL